MAAQIVKACKTAGITPVAAITTLYDRKTPYLFDNAGYIIADGNWSWLDALPITAVNRGPLPLFRRCGKLLCGYMESLQRQDFPDIELENTVFPELPVL